MGFWQWLSGKKKESSPLTSPTPSPDPLIHLLTALTEASAKRFQATLEHESRVEELSLKRHEIDVQNAEILQKAAAADRIAKQELREQKKLWAREHLPQKRAAQREAAQCKVCRNPNDPNLSQIDIQAHYSENHNGQLQLTS